MFWPQEEIVYPLHFKRMNVRIDDALRTIRGFLDSVDRPYVSVSWGKDSIVVMDLCYRVRPIPVIWVDRGRGGDIPATLDVVAHYEDAGYDIRRIPTPMSIMDLHRRYSIDELERGGHIPKMLKETFRDAERDFDGSLWGIRAEESPARKKMARGKGKIFRRRSGLLVCSPILGWTARDVWAYIHGRGLRYSAAYDMLAAGPMDRERLRQSNVAGIVNIGNGRMSELKRLAPDIYQELAEIRPEIKGFP